MRMLIQKGWCVAAEIRPHLGVLEDKQKQPEGRAGLYGERDTYRCPAGQQLKRSRACALRGRCTTAVAGRNVQRHEQAALVAAGKAIAHRPHARQRTRVQAFALAAAVAPRDPGLTDRGRAECEDPGVGR